VQQPAQHVPAPSADGTWLQKSHTIASGFISRMGGWNNTNNINDEVTPSSDGGVGSTGGLAPEWDVPSGHDTQNGTQQASWAHTWPAASLNPVSDPVFEPTSVSPKLSAFPRPAADPSGGCTLSDLRPEADPVFVAPGSGQQQPTFAAEYSFNTDYSAPPTTFPGGAFPSGLHGSTGASLQADLWNGTEPWNVEQPTMPAAQMHASHAPSAGTIGGGRSFWACEKCGFKNAASATRCGACSWDRKAALKMRMRQDLMQDVKMTAQPPAASHLAQNGGLNGGLKPSAVIDSMEVGHRRTGSMENA